jgi:hypothetical protein
VYLEVIPEAQGGDFFGYLFFCSKIFWGGFKRTLSVYGGMDGEHLFQRGWIALDGMFR